MPQSLFRKSSVRRESLGTIAFSLERFTLDPNPLRLGTDTRVTQSLRHCGGCAHFFGGALGSSLGFSHYVCRIDATPSSLTVSDPAVNAFTTSLDGALYVFAVNTSTAATIRTSFTLAGLAGRPVAVYGGGRGPTSSGDTFADSLPPLGWRIYLVAP